MKKFHRAILLLFLTTSVIMAVACGSSESPTPGTANSPQPTAKVVAAEPTADETKAVSDLATSIAAIQNPSTPVPAADAATPRPEVELVRKFRFASLNGTLLGWQVRGNDGELCQSVSDLYIAMKVKLENTASKPYILRGELIHLVDKNAAAPDTLGGGDVFFGKEGQGNLDIPAESAVETTLCADLAADDEADAMTLVLGYKEAEQSKVPLAANGPADLGGLVTAPLGKTVKFKGAEFVMPQEIVTTGVWSDQDTEGQSHQGKEWLLIPTEVNVTEAANLFVEENEISLDVAGQTVPRALSFAAMYQPAPYGLEKGKSGKGALLFEIPLGTHQATLHFKALKDGFTDDVSVPLTLPGL